jgi:hypothetical protein
MYRRPSDERAFEEVLDLAVQALDASSVHYALMGGVAATALGGHRYTHDIDVFVRPQDAERTLSALAAAGFEPERTDPNWLFKAKHSDIEVDIIFRSAGPVFFDAQMIERSARAEFHGRSLRVIAPEDLFIIKALVLNEHSLGLDEHCMRHLNDLLSIVRLRELDWDYLLRRARVGPRRVLGLLLYAQSLDLLVPNRVLKDLVRMLDLCD